VSIARKFAFIGGLLALSLILSFATVPPTSVPQRRPCGHATTMTDRIGKWVPIPRATHCCSSGSLVNELRSFDGSQEMFIHLHGRAARNLDELNRDPKTAVRISVPFQFQSNGTNWTVIVPKTPTLAGNYLLDDQGGIFFNENRTPTTNDFALR
jgi:hypothetical protein